MPNSIRGIRFSKNCREKDFRYAIAGHHFYQRSFLIIFSIIIACLGSALPAFSGQVLSAVIYRITDINYIYLVLYVLILFLLVIRSLEINTAIIILIVVILNAVITTVVGYKNTGIASASFGLLLSVISAWLGITIISFSIILGSIYLKYLGKISTILGSIISTYIIVEISFKLSSPETYASQKSITLVGASLALLASLAVAESTKKGTHGLRWIREKAIFWSATGGTSFYEVDLTGAFFDNADLRFTDFRKANLSCTSFKGSKGLELARLQGTILEDPKVRELIVRGEGRGKDFTDANLNGANLQHADLREAILVKVSALDTDFSGATLTNSCIQDWRINRNTRFNNVKCQRIYLKCSEKGHFLEPKPDSGEFKSGEFAKWIGEIHDTVDLIFRNGLNWRAFAFSLTQTAIEHDDLGLSIQSIENKGDGVVVAKVNVSPEIDKTNVHQKITQYYKDAIQAIEGKYQLVLEAHKGEINRLVAFNESQQNFIQDLVGGIAEKQGKVLVQGEGNRVYIVDQVGNIMESTNQNISAGGNIDMSNGDVISVGGNVVSSSITLGDLNRQVMNTIQQLKEISTSDNNELVSILTSLQDAINSDSTLSANEKQQALEAVSTLADEGKKPPESRTLKFCSMAVNALKGIANTVTDASKLAEILKTYLPTLTALFGLH